MFRFVLASVIAGVCVLAVAQEGQEQAKPADGSAASQPAGSTEPAANETQTRILEELLRDAQNARPTPILSEPGVGREGAEEESGRGMSLLPDGYSLSELAGRVVRHGSRVEFHFTSGSPVSNAPDVMEFNKNRWLEAMEGEAEAGVTEFIISAEVTRYRGQNYLNLLKYRRQISHGNLSP